MGTADPMPDAATSRPEEAWRVLRPTRGWIGPRLDELWAFRELLYFLTWRDVKVRYKQTVLGAAWAVIQPLGTMVVFSIFFGRLAGVPSDGQAYPVFAFVALVPWSYFASAVAHSANSVVEHQRVITKVYFPRLALPVSGVLAGLPDFLCAFAVLLALMAWYGVMPGLAVLALPLFLLLAMAAALAVGLWLSALNAIYRDVRYVIPFLIQVWLFATPIAYPTSLVPERWRLVYGLNPMVGVVDGFRWSLLGAPAGPPASLGVSALVVAALILGGIACFRRMERSFADVV